MAGRPTMYTQALCEDICTRIASGESLVDICKTDGYPSTVTVYDWLNNDAEFANRYTRAREDQAETLADQIIGIADESYNDHDIDENGNVRVNSEAIQRSKLRVEARKWVAAKLKPKKYGDKITQEITGKDGGSIKSEHVIATATPQEAAEVYARLMQGK